MLSDKELAVRIYERTKLNPNQADDRTLFVAVFELLRDIERAATGAAWVSIKDRRPTDSNVNYLVASSWGVRMVVKHCDEWAKGCFQDMITGADEGMRDHCGDRDGKFVVTHWMPLPAAPDAIRAEAAKENTNG